MLWIVTQNKGSLINPKEVTVKGKYVEGVMGRGLFNEWSRTLGKYESNERASEILKQITLKLEESKSNSATFIMPKK